ncbi:T9SS type A sorting domain-containing protein [uncultured Parabacteroides sp.]|uniref:T9SS type A sorting domain-containing protein n=1 Tax=uncultured Parabacteroides sp. TaxID=512312 RepID=UPI002596FDFA|nr:T9SS type A sorting domain-containing protein [uncultured Parabacteroides sp.]
MKTKKFTFFILSSCLFFMAQTVNAQYYGYENDLRIEISHKNIAEPSHISSLDYCDVKLINIKGSGYFCPKPDQWYGDFHFMQEDRIYPTAKGHFLKAGTCTINARIGGSTVISKSYEISDPYLTSTSTILVYGNEATVEILNLPPREDVSITWHVSEGLKIVSGQGTTKVVYTTNEKASSYEFISVSVQSEVWVVGSRNNVTVIGAPRYNEIQLSRIASNMFTLDIDQEETHSSPLKYELYDQMRGSLMRKGMVESKSGVLNFENVPKGIYVLKLYLDEKNIQTRKILIN